MRKPPATPIPSHQEGIGDGSANSVLIPEQVGGPLAEWINKHIRSPHGWGGWPLYDYIVDCDWADTGWPEGTVINQYTGTKIYSTVQGAVTDIDAADAPKSVFVCGGWYAEAVTVGYGTWLSLEGTMEVLGNSTVINSLTLAGANCMSMKGIEITGDVSVGSWAELRWDHCTIDGKFYDPAAAGSGNAPLTDSKFTNCVFHGRMEASGGIVEFVNCDCPGSLYIREYANTVTFVGGHIDGGRYWPTDPLEDCVRIGTQCQDISFVGTFFHITGPSTTKPDQCAYVAFVDDKTGGSCKRITLEGCTFNGGQATKPLYLINNRSSSPVDKLIIGGCSYLPDGGIDQGIDGAFTDSTFGPNAPDDIDYTGITGTGNVIYQGGAGTGSANDDLYVRVDGTHPLTADWYPGAFNIGNFDFSANVNVLSISDELFSVCTHYITGDPGFFFDWVTPQTYGDAIFYDRSFSLDDYLQAQDRIHRISQNKTCYVTNLIMQDSIDEWVDVLLHSKQLAAQLAQGDVSLEYYQSQMSYDFAHVLRAVLNIQKGA